jgi:hypothetical protein
MDDELAKQATRMAARAGMPLGEPPVRGITNSNNPNIINNGNDNTTAKRKNEAEERKGWEKQRGTHLYESQKPTPKKNTNNNNNNNSSNTDETIPTNFQRGVTVKTGRTGRSALSNRSTTNSKPDIFMPNVEKGGLDPKTFADGKKNLQDQLVKDIKGDGGSSSSSSSSSNDVVERSIPESEAEKAAARTSEIVAKAGAGKAFEGSSLGIGGLDEVLSQVKRRIWVPLAGMYICIHVHMHT